MTLPVDPAVVEGIARDPGAFLQQLDTLQRRALCVRLNEAELRAASFLDERLGLQGREGFWLSLDTLLEVSKFLVGQALAPNYIFHIGHCGSTLISRLLDRSDGVLGLREPLALRELAATCLQLNSPLSRISAEEWNALLTVSMNLLGRGFSPGQRTLIKATSSCNNLIGKLLDHATASRAILLYIPLESYLATMLKAPGGGLDALHSAPARLQYLHETLGDESPRLHELDHPEILAMGWLAELARFRQVEAADAWSGRIMLLDFEEWLQQPDALLDAVRKHLGMAASTGDTAPVKLWPEMSAYAKSPGHAYSPEDRVHDLDLSRRKFSSEIAAGLRFAERMAGRHPKLQSLL